jgi:TPR repeat protein
MYRKGERVEKDLEKSKHFYRKACDGNHLK